MNNKEHWNQIMDQVHKIKDRYGSIHNTPRSDPDFKKLQDLCGVSPVNHINPLTGMSASRAGIIASKITQGHTNSNRCKVCFEAS